MVDTSRAKKLSESISMAGNIPSPASPILKGVGYGLRALTIIGDIRNARESATIDYHNKIKQMQINAMEQAKKITTNKKIVLFSGIGIALLGVIILLAKRNK